MNWTERKLKWLGAGVFTLIALIVYTMTMAPTVSFWDCGEFISTANILGVPHPPGAAIHHVLGRVAILTFGWFGDIGARTNWISALAGALTAGTAYLVAFRATQMLQNRKEKSDFVWAAAIGGAFAALLVTFSDTFWFSSVETEMYSPAMFATLLGIYLMLEWTDLRHTEWGDRILVFVVYISFLATNFTLFTVMFLPIIGIWMVVVDAKKRTQWPIYIAAVLIMSIIYMPGKFVFIATGTVVAFGLLWLIPRFLMGAASVAWVQASKLAFVISFAALLGWSVYLYIPIRSALDPIIDEGDPEIRAPLVLEDPSTYENLAKTPSWKDALKYENWGEFQEYIERKQYGSENPLVRAMTRRSNPLNQLFVHENMGYGGYMFQQFLPFKVTKDETFLGISIPSQMAAVGVSSTPGPDGRYVQPAGWPVRRLAQLAMFLLAHIPLWWLFKYTYKRDKVLAVYLAALYLFASMGIMWYVNFADGTRPEVANYHWWLRNQDQPFPGPVHMEVRERDYFYTPAYVLVALFYGMSMGLFLQKLRQSSKVAIWKSDRKFVAWLVAFSMAPAIAGYSNWDEHNRHYNHIPYDYAYNLLNSCQPNAILFTNGDNDTFPLWALQEAYGVRRDVRVVNLSLLNTDWYIRQMRDIEPRVPINMSDAYIKTLQVQETRNPYPDGSVVQVGARQIQFPGPQQLPYLKVQDVMIMNIVMTNDKAKVRKPIQFAATVGDDNMLGLAPYCRMEGMVFTLTDSVQTNPVDVPRTRELFEKVYKFRGLGADQKGKMDDDSRRLLGNYSSIAIQVAMASAETAKRLIDSAAVVEATDPAAAKQLRDGAEKQITEVRSLLLRAQELVPTEWRTSYFASQMFVQLGRIKSADSVLVEGMKRMPNEPMLRKAQVDVYQRSNRPALALKAMEELIKSTPADPGLLVDFALMLSEAGRNDQALATINQAISMGANDQRTQAVAQMIQAKAQGGGMPGMPGMPGMQPQAPAPAGNK